MWSDVADWSGRKRHNSNEQVVCILIEKSGDGKVSKTSQEHVDTSFIHELL